MYHKILAVWLIINLQLPLIGQESLDFTGVILDSISGNPVQGAHIHGENILALSDSAGIFQIPSMSNFPIHLRITHIGYQSKEVFLSQSDLTTNHKIVLAPSLVSLEAVRVTDKTPEREAREEPLVSVSVSEKFLEENRENSLMQTLKKLPGIGSMNIGSGQSKPTIRGLGFNRVVVVQEGIKHEAQQWGVDHGLEIDQYAIDQIRIIKGPASLLYGSDAIAGTIVIEPSPTPLKHSISSDVHLIGQTNNHLLGTSAAITARKDAWYIRGGITYQNFGDYRVPTNRINYDSYIFDLHQNYLRNTAGREFNTRFQLGWLKDQFHSTLSISNVYNRGGFFANAHKLEVRTSQIDFDRSSRDIDLPYHLANHFKLTHRTNISGNTHDLQIDWGFQNNHREEHAEPTAHGYMPKPSNTLERNFNKNTMSFNVRDAVKLSQRMEFTTGVNLEYQSNKIGGWGFLIPEYHRFSASLFALSDFAIQPNLHVKGGVRYDYGSIGTQSYFDWFDTPHTHEDGTVTSIPLQRAYKDQYQFDNVSASLGVSYLQNGTTYKFNVGRSFRIPLAHELASDGENYHMYRFEKGNPDLDAEISYQMDFEIDHKSPVWRMGISPFINYFDNYIFLNPGFEYYESLQKYEYTQSKVLRAGGELHAGITLFQSLDLMATGEYVWSRIQSGTKKGFTLPFSPPLSFLFTAKHTFMNWDTWGQPSITIDYRETAAQNRIIPPEKRSNGYRTFDVSFQTELAIFQNFLPLKLKIKINNVFDTKYFDHSSFYRLIEVPEPGRNATLSIHIPFVN